MKKSRTKNSAINVSVAAFSKVIYVLLSFICRTVFIKTLGAEYLGVNGLFTNILTILSFAELGIGNAIIFKLYKPVADGDIERQKTLMRFYKKAYWIIGGFVLVTGILVIPFLNLIIKDIPNIWENIAFIYMLFLLNTSISYFYTYKRSIIIAHQEEYVTSIVDLFATVIMNIAQMIYLWLTHNYIGYLVIQIISTVTANIIISHKANKKYPYIKDNNYTKMTKEEQKGIFNDVKSLMLYKLGYVLSNGTDNIIISSFIGVKQVGLLSNYTTVITAITSLLSTAFDSLTASIGNLNTIKDRAKKESVFYQILLLSFFIYSYFGIAVALLSNKFISIWLGNDYVLEIYIAAALGFNLFIHGMRYVNYTFRNTLGLFKKGRLMPLFSSISNVIFSIILAQYIGMFGVLIATGLTRLLILTWYDPYLIHKNEFKTSSIRYYRTYSYYLIVTAISAIVCYMITKSISIQGIIGFILNGVIITFVVFGLSILATFKLKEFRELKEKIINTPLNKIKQLQKKGEK